MATIQIGHKKNLFNVFPEDLVREVVQYRKDLERLVDYSCNPLPLVFCRVIQNTLYYFYKWWYVVLSFKKILKNKFNICQTVLTAVVFHGILGLFRITDQHLETAGDYFRHLPIYRVRMKKQ